jgi:hypothetical protein
VEGSNTAPFAGTNRIRFDGCVLSRERGTPVSSGYLPTIGRVRILALPGLVGIWHTASLLHGSTVVTAAFTLGAAVLAVWALAVLRDG